MSLWKDEENRIIFVKHSGNLTLQTGVEFKPQKGKSWPTQPSRLKSIAKSKSSLCSFANQVDFCQHTKKWPVVSRFWKIWFFRRLSANRFSVKNTVPQNSNSSL